MAVAKLGANQRGFITVDGQTAGFEVRRAMHVRLVIGVGAAQRDGRQQGARVPARPQPRERIELRVEGAAQLGPDLTRLGAQ